MEEQCELCKVVDTEDSPCSCFICAACSGKALDAECSTNKADQEDENMYCKPCSTGRVYD